MKVKFFANLRNITKVREVELEAENVEQLLSKLVEMYGEPFREAVFDNGKIKKFYKILHNGHDIDFKKGLKTKLDKDDTVAIFPPAGGGN